MVVVARADSFGDVVVLLDPVGITRVDFLTLRSVQRACQFRYAQLVVRGVVVHAGELHLEVVHGIVGVVHVVVDDVGGESSSVVTVESWVNLSGQEVIRRRLCSG